MRNLLQEKSPYEPLTVTQFKEHLPRSKQHLVTNKVVEDINRMFDSEFREVYKDNLLRFGDVLEDYGNQGVKGYADAVLFVSFRLLGKPVYEAWQKTFPDRAKRVEREGYTEEDARNWAKAYARGQMVSKIMERSMIPVYIVNADIHQEAINVQAELMRYAKSEQVRQKAAECLITNLKPPEEATLNVRINHSSDALDELRAVTRGLAVAQREAILAGRAGVRQIAESPLNGDDEDVIEGEFISVGSQAQKTAQRDSGPLEN